MRPRPPPFPPLLPPPSEPLESCFLLLGSSLSSGLNFQAPRMVVRGAGSGAGFGAFAPVAGAGCEGAAAIGPDGACACASAAASRPIAANPVNTVRLKTQTAFMFGSEFVNLSLYQFPPREERVPSVRCRRLPI